MVDQLMRLRGGNGGGALSTSMILFATAGWGKDAIHTYNITRTKKLPFSRESLQRAGWK
jgi:hypothetical protein